MELLANVSWTAVAGALAAYLLGLAFYRLHLHPLSKFPGPRLAAATRYYEAYYDLICNGQYTFKIAELHKKYGPIIRISPHELHVADPAFYEKLFNHEGRWNKYAWTYDAFAASSSTICTVAHEVHKRRRAPLNAYFSKANVTRHQAILHRLAAKLCSRMEEFVQSRQPCNISEIVSAFTRDASAEFILGKDFGNLDAPKFRAEMTGALQQGGTAWRITKHVRFFAPMMKSLPLGLVERIGDDGTRSFLHFLKDMLRLTEDAVDAQGSSQAEAADADDRTQRSLLHDIVSSKILIPAEKTVPRLHDEIATIAGAGFETSANTLRLILFYVYTNPRILENLRAEIASLKHGSMSYEDGIPVASLERLPYLTAVIMEGLRLSPGVATRTARVAPDRELQYEEWAIPQGTPVGMTTFLMHRDEALYPEPDTFQLERWMDTGARKKANKTFVPFSRGARMCLGMHFAWAEMYIAVAQLVDTFTLDFEGVTAQDVECSSDQFAVGIKDYTRIKAKVTRNNSS